MIAKVDKIYPTLLSNEGRPQLHIIYRNLKFVNYDIYIDDNYDVGDLLTAYVWTLNNDKRILRLTPPNKFTEAGA